jgi:hypothetical protein
MPQHNKIPRTLTEIRSLARGHTRTAINALVGVMRAKDATHAARVSAANAILDRGWGKAAQAIETGDGAALELIHKIERVIHQGRLSAVSAPASLGLASHAVLAKAGHGQGEQMTAQPQR